MNLFLELEAQCVCAFTSVDLETAVLTGKLKVNPQNPYNKNY